MARERGSLAVDLNGIAFPTPVMAASGCFGSGVEMTEAIDLRRVGAIITKSVTLKPRWGNPTPRMAETPSGMLNSIGLQNPGIDGFIAKDVPFLQRLPIPVIVSIAGKSVEEFVQVAVRVNEIPNVAAIEANISCPNVARRNQVFACHPDQAAEVIGAVARMSRLPVFAKLTPDVTDIVEVADACVRAGAHGLSLINTLLGMALDVETERPLLGALTGGLSGPAIRPVAVRAVYQVARALPEVPIIGMGGISTGRDAAEFILAGAWAVAVGTANFFNPHATIDVAHGLAEILARKTLRSPAELRGRVIGASAPAEPAHRGG
ncbi:MAG: dihydroorotate dehydrogenase [Actinobacteria bacterium]|nr:dihydroorotate dehydrogenase [Actinomycetota bacterium]